MYNHLVLIAATGTESNFTGLVGEYGFMRVIVVDEDVFSW